LCGLDFIFDFLWGLKFANMYLYKYIPVDNVDSRINFRRPIPKLFPLTSIQELKYEFHFTDIQLTLLLFPWSRLICPPTTRLSTYDRKTFSRSLFRKGNLWANSCCCCCCCLLMNLTQPPSLEFI